MAESTAEGVCTFSESGVDSTISWWAVAAAVAISGNANSINPSFTVFHLFFITIHRFFKAAKLLLIIRYLSPQPAHADCRYTSVLGRANPHVKE